MNPQMLQDGFKSRDYKSSQAAMQALVTQCSSSIPPPHTESHPGSPWSVPCSPAIKGWLRNGFESRDILEESTAGGRGITHSAHLILASVSTFLRKALKIKPLKQQRREVCPCAALCILLQVLTRAQAHGQGSVWALSRSRGGKGSSGSITFLSQHPASCSTPMENRLNPGSWFTGAETSWVQDRREEEGEGGDIFMPDLP